MTSHIPNSSAFQRGINKARADRAREQMYRAWPMRKRLTSGQLNRRLTKRNGHWYHVTKGYRGLVRP